MSVYIFEMREIQWSYENLTRKPNMGVRGRAGGPAASLSAATWRPEEFGGLVSEQAL